MIGLGWLWQLKNVNEIQQFVDARYVSATECCWRLFNSRIHNQTPKTIRLAVHLEERQSVYFRDSDTLQDLLQRNHDSTLMAWFKLNRVDPEARQWKKRSRHGNVIGRIYFVHPSDMERYCLRLLLLNVRGAQSFDDLKTVNNITHINFRSAALALGLLADDLEWDNCLAEAAAFKYPKQLRQLFAVLLLACEIANPLQLWRKYKSDFIEDLAHNASDPVNTTELEINALKDLDFYLQASGRRITDYPDIVREYGDFHFDDNNHDILLDSTTREYLQQHMLNPEQQAAFDAISAAIGADTAVSRLFFIDGPAGTGKSFLYNTLISHAKGSLNKKVLVVASSGIASLILHDGRTAHSTFKIPVKLEATSTCNFTAQSKVAKSIREMAAIFWDEAPMVHRWAFEAMDRSIRDVTGCDLPFGGKVIIMGGDFRQILPVVKKGTQAQIERACIKFSEYWSQVVVLRLTRNMRVRRDSDAQFIDYLLRLGNGNEHTIPHQNFNDFVRLPDSFVINLRNTEPPHMALINAVYNNPSAMCQDPAYII